MPFLGDDSAGSSKVRSFLEVLQSKPRLECLDSLQIWTQVAVRTGREDLRTAMDCCDLEASMMAAGSAKKEPTSVRRRVENLLGFFLLELGRVFAGLLKGLLEGPGLPSKKRVWAFLKGLGFGLSLLPKPVGHLMGLNKCTCKW